MSNPFKDGGVVDKAMPWLLLGTALVHLCGDLSAYRHGGALGWQAPVAVAVALAALYLIGNRLWKRRRASGSGDRG